MGGAAAYVPRAWPQCKEVVPRRAGELFPLAIVLGYYQLYLREIKINDMSVATWPWTAERLDCSFWYQLLAHKSLFVPR